MGNVAHFLEITGSQSLVKITGQKSKHQVRHSTSEVQLTGRKNKWYSTD